MDQLPPALPHGPLEEMFPDVFFVTGMMKTVLANAPWQFNRNMTVVRDGDALTLINSVRLNDAGLLELDALGRATMPFAGCEVFTFRTTKLPECILRIDRAGGILVACDSLQNWLAPDSFFSDESRQLMTEMGFFQPANLGPLWMQVNEPQAHDFSRLNELQFRHALCGHGVPLRDTAKEAYAAAFKRAFGV